MNNIGIAVLTCGIRNLDERILKYNPFIYLDRERKGAAFCRNKIMKKFYDEGKDYIFIFDDDCYPVIEGWQEKIINWTKENNIHYLAGLDLKNVSILGGKDNTIFSKDCYIGAYFFIDRKCIDTIGYYNTAYKKYGYEDITYSRRAKAASLLGDSEGYPFPVWMNMYIHSMDMFCENPMQNMAQEQKEYYIKLNKQSFVDEMENIEKGKLYYGY